MPDKESRESAYRVPTAAGWLRMRPWYSSSPPALFLVPPFLPFPIFLDFSHSSMLESLSPRKYRTLGKGGRRGREGAGYLLRLGPELVGWAER